MTMLEKAVEGLQSEGILTISKMPFAVEFLWPEDGLQATDVLALPAVIVMEKPSSRRRVAFQIVREQLRYWLSMDTMDGSLSARNESGTLRTVDDAIRLCREFLVSEIDLAEVAVPRQIARR